MYDFAWPERGVPEMEKLVDLCRSMDAWLRADSKNVIVVHCHVSRVTSASTLQENSLVCHDLSPLCDDPLPFLHKGLFMSVVILYRYVYRMA